MRFLHVAGAALGALVGLAAVSASAATVTYYDVVTHRYVTYDPEKVLRDAHSQTAMQMPKQNIEPVLDKNRKADPRFDWQEVAYQTEEKPGTIIIDTKDKFLYYVEDGGKAVRAGVGVGREGFGWKGVVHVGSKQENPKWFPPPDMVQRQPELAKYTADGMPGGDGNPLGVRALYLYDEKGKDTLYRIHGTIEPWSIGLNVSSGCIRMLNENVTRLYDMVDVGTKVVVE
jgi:lipoprotein-anchoring transpeptidase ErfK/SrfK